MTEIFREIYAVKPKAIAFEDGFEEEAQKTDESSNNNLNDVMENVEADSQEEGPKSLLLHI